ncbi:MAG: BioY family transporter [Desulfotalea sp.]|nr:MAG: BioY family transporter [Desulfotalea sp.]
MKSSVEQKNDLNISNQLQMTVYSSLMAALIAVGAFIAIPIGPVPIVLQNLFVMLAGLLLGARWGMASVGVYLLAGVCGLPVFSGGGAGIGHFFGPTGGYLLSYLPAVFVVGSIAERSTGLFARTVGLVGAHALIFLMGVTWLKVATGMSIAKAMAVGMFPFLIGDVVKIVAAILIARALQPLVAKHNIR